MKEYHGYETEGLSKTTLVPVLFLEITELAWIKLFSFDSRTTIVRVVLVRYFFHLGVFYFHHKNSNIASQLFYSSFKALHCMQVQDLLPSILEGTEA